MTSNWSMYSGVICIAGTFVILSLSIFLAIKDQDKYSEVPDPVVNELRKQWIATQVINASNRNAEHQYHHNHQDI